MHKRSTIYTDEMISHLLLRFHLSTCATLTCLLHSHKHLLTDKSWVSILSLCGFPRREVWVCMCEFIRPIGNLSGHQRPVCGFLVDPASCFKTTIQPRLAMSLSWDTAWCPPSCGSVRLSTSYDVGLASPSPLSPPLSFSLYMLTISLYIVDVVNTQRWHLDAGFNMAGSWSFDISILRPVSQLIARHNLSASSRCWWIVVSLRVCLVHIVGKFFRHFVYNV